MRMPTCDTCLLFVTGSGWFNADNGLFSPSKINHINSVWFNFDFT